MGEPRDDGDGTGLPRDLRFLKTLVTVLTATMILGVVAITVLLALRLGDARAPVRLDPGAFALPEGVDLIGISVLDDVTVIVADDRVIRIYDSATTALLDEIPMAR